MKASIASRLRVDSHTTVKGSEAASFYLGYKISTVMLTPSTAAPAGQRLLHLLPAEVQAVAPLAVPVLGGGTATVLLALVLLRLRPLLRSSTHKWEQARLDKQRQWQAAKQSGTEAPDMSPRKVLGQSLPRLPLPGWLAQAGRPAAVLQQPGVRPAEPASTADVVPAAADQSLEQQWSLSQPQGAEAGTDEWGRPVVLLGATAPSDTSTPSPTAPLLSSAEGEAAPVLWRRAEDEEEGSVASATTEDSASTTPQAQQSSSDEQNPVSAPRGRRHKVSFAELLDNVEQPASSRTKQAAGSR